MEAARPSHWLAQGERQAAAGLLRVGQDVVDIEQAQGRPAAFAGADFAEKGSVGGADAEGAIGGGRVGERVGGA